MADGELTLKLTDDTARRLRAAADEAGLSVESYAAGLIVHGLALGDDWIEDVARIEEAERTGEWLSVEEAMAHFDAALQARLEAGR